METMTTLTERLARMDWPEIQALAVRSGVPYHTIAKIKRGETLNPRIATVEALFSALKQAA